MTNPKAASKVAQLKANCGYQAKPTPRQCGNCGAFKSDMKLPDWIASGIKTGRYSEEQYPASRYGIEKNKRCGAFGFAVMKTAVCSEWIPVAKNGS